MGRRWMCLLVLLSGRLLGGALAWAPLGGARRPLAAAGTRAPALRFSGTPGGAGDDAGDQPTPPRDPAPAPPAEAHVDLPPLGEAAAAGLDEAATADLSYRVAKLRLEEQNTRRFLKARPRFLPYEDCRRWVQAWARWRTAEDWRAWISLGEKRNAYIPSQPDQYYQSTGDWRGWAHFLGVDDDPNAFQ